MFSKLKGRQPQIEKAAKELAKGVDKAAEVTRNVSDALELSKGTNFCKDHCLIGKAVSVNDDNCKKCQPEEGWQSTYNILKSTSWSISTWYSST